MDGEEMGQSNRVDSPRLDIIIAFLIALVSITFALAAWRVSLVASSAGDANRRGILDTVKKQAATNEDWRKTYEEANYAESYAAYLAEIKTLEASGDPAEAAQAANLRQYLLPSLQLMASPLASEPVYQNPDGTYDLQKRFDALEATTPDLSGLDPQASFQLANRYFSEQRWLTVATVLLAISLFWLALAQVSGKRLRLTTLIIGIVVYAISLLAVVGIEGIFIFLRGGVL
jgi:hypothetical protein